jgi:hypothetical protein
VVGPLHDDSRSLRALVPAGCFYRNKRLTIWPACSGAYGLRALDLEPMRRECGPVPLGFGQSE